MADEKVTWHRYTEGAKDRYGRATFTFTDEEILAKVAPGQSSEPRRGFAHRTIAAMTIYASITPDEQDEFTVRGKRYGVEGETGNWANPFTGTSFGVEIPLRKVSG